MREMQKALLTKMNKQVFYLLIGGIITWVLLLLSCVILWNRNRVLHSENEFLHDEMFRMEENQVSVFRITNGGEKAISAMTIEYMTNEFNKSAEVKHIETGQAEVIKLVTRYPVSLKFVGQYEGGEIFTDVIEGLTLSPGEEMGVVIKNGHVLFR